MYLFGIACACYIALHVALHVPVCHCMCLLYCTTCSATCTYLALHVPVRAAACVYYHFIHAVELHRLLHWRNNEERLPSILTLVTKVPGDEIVKVRLYTVRTCVLTFSSSHICIQFLGDTFNALFAIMEERVDTVGDLVFEALVRTV